MNRVNNDRGVVALMTSIIVSLLLIVITGSGVAIMRAELRQATDFDLSVKSYFAAESGLEDALAKVRDDLAADGKLTPKDTCTPYSTSDASLSQDGSSYLDAAVSYTCQVVTVSQTNLESQLSKEESIQIDLSGADSFNKIVLSWNQEGTSDPSNWTGSNLPTSFPPGASWTDTYPSVLELQVVSYPKSASFSSSEIDNRLVVLKPSTVASDTQNQVNIQSVNNPERIRCDQSTTAGDYECSATLQMPPGNNNYVLNIHARYSSTHFKIEAFNGSNKVNIPGTQIAVDVTGKAGDVFRRIQAKGFLTYSSPIPFAILTDDSLCKVLEVTGNTTTAGGESGCAP